MIRFTVNGKEIALNSVIDGSTDEISLQERKVQEFMAYVRRQFNSDAAVISSIRVNGAELNGEDDEAKIAEVPLSAIDSVEIFTAHPRELAEETLQSLIDFTVQLEQLSQQAGAKLQSNQVPQEFMRLIDGIDTFSDALTQVKGILRISSLDPVKVLEADLISILKDLVEFTHRGQRDYVIDLLTQHLPLNLQDWRTQGIPALIRSRDS